MQLDNGARLVCDVPLLALPTVAPALAAGQRRWRSTRSGFVSTAPDAAECVARRGVCRRRRGVAQRSRAAAQRCVRGARRARAGAEPAAPRWPAGRCSRGSRRSARCTCCRAASAVPSHRGAQFSAQGRWVWWWKDRIDRRFVARYAEPAAGARGRAADQRRTRARRRALRRGALTRAAERRSPARRHAAVGVARQLAGAVDRAQHGVVPVLVAAALDEPAAEDGAVGRGSAPRRRRPGCRAPSSVEQDVRLDARDDACRHSWPTAPRRARPCRWQSGAPVAPAWPSMRFRLSSRCLAWRASSAFWRLTSSSRCFCAAQLLGLLALDALLLLRSCSCVRAPVRSRLRFALGLLLRAARASLRSAFVLLDGDLRPRSPTAAVAAAATLGVAPAAVRAAAVAARAWARPRGGAATCGTAAHSSALTPAGVWLRQLTRRAPAPAPAGPRAPAAPAARRGPCRRARCGRSGSAAVQRQRQRRCIHAALLDRQADALHAGALQHVHHLAPRPRT